MNMDREVEKYFINMGLFNKQTISALLICFGVAQEVTCNVELKIHILRI